MKKIMLTVALAVATLQTTAMPISILTEKLTTGSIDIKIKNDTDDEVRVYNAGSGGSYTLTKGATTTIKMDEGDKLYYYENGKKGDLILTASSDMDGKVQLLSKL